FVRVMGWLILAGGAAALFALLVEVVIALFVTASRRSAFAANALVQAALAFVLLVAVNWLSFGHYARLDWSGDGRLTLDTDIQRQMRGIKGKTTIVVYQQHKEGGGPSGKTDEYDSAANRKVIEKVRDLVEQFREFGPQFEVIVLDMKDTGSKDEKARVTRE